MKTIQINQPLLHSIYGDCTEGLTEVFTEFLKTHSDIKENLISSFHSGKETFKRALHFHAPSFVYIGIPVITDCLKKMEQECDLADERSFSSEFSDLIHMIDLSKSMVQDELTHLRHTD